MNMKKWISAAVALMLCVVFAAVAAAEVSGINIMSVRPVENAPQMFFEVRAQDSTGTGVRVQQQDFRFTAGEDNVELMATPLSGGNQGHIIVVDTSLYYYGNDVIKISNIRDIVLAYLSRLSSEERVMFVLATDAKQPTCTQYMTLESAREFARGIAFGKEKSAKINSAIYQAFQYAVAPDQSAPMFNSVFVVADPDLASNSGDDRNLGECMQLRASSGRNFDVAVAVLYREAFLKGTNDTRRKALNDGFAKYEEFARQCGGEYIRISQTNDGVATDDLHERLSQWLYTTNSFLVDFSPLSGHVPLEPQMQKVTVAVSCKDAGGNALRSVEVELDTALLPPPAVTPEPTPSEPTPTPAPTPIVHMGIGQSDSAAMQAIYALRELNYLTKSSIKEFDNECFLAYIAFCEVNGIDPKDGIYEDTYELLTKGSPIPAATTTPAPTATPEPTIPPEGFAINDQDTESNGGYIAQMQAILKALNCYEEGAVSNVGRLDQATVDAVNKYCEAFNWHNDHPNGVIKTVCSDILTYGPSRQPLVPKEPTAQEKVKAFLAGSTLIANYAVPNMALVGACFALVIIIFLVLILRKPGKSSKEDKKASDQHQMQKKTEGGQSSGKSGMSSGSGSFDDEDGSTVPSHAYKYVMLEIDFAGTVTNTEISLKENADFAVGRKDSRNVNPELEPQLALDAADKRVSRGKHGVFRYKNGNVYIHDASRYHDMTVNGLPVAGREGRDGVVIESGDEIILGQHRIKVTF